LKFESPSPESITAPTDFDPRSRLVGTRAAFGEPPPMKPDLFTELLSLLCAIRRLCVTSPLETPKRPHLSSAAQNSGLEIVFLVRANIVRIRLFFFCVISSSSQSTLPFRSPSSGVTCNFTFSRSLLSTLWALRLPIPREMLVPFFCAYRKNLSRLFVLCATGASLSSYIALYVRFTFLLFRLIIPF